MNRLRRPAAAVIAALIAVGYSRLPAQDPTAGLGHTGFYAVRSLATEQGAVFFRFRPDTGATWVLDGDDGVWRPVSEPGDASSRLLSNGVYDIAAERSGDAYSVVRLDRIGGKSWILDRQAAWVPVKEAVPIPPPPADGER